MIDLTMRSNVFEYRIGDARLCRITICRIFGALPPKVKLKLTESRIYSKFDIRVKIVGHNDIIWSKSRFFYPFLYEMDCIRHLYTLNLPKNTWLDVCLIGEDVS